MDENLAQIIEKSIELEMKIANLYTIFQTAFPEDATFWKQMVLEERNHAAMIGGARTAFLQENDFPSDLLTSNTQALEHAINKVKALIKQYRKNSPSREQALITAMEIEDSAGEVHYQQAMEITTPALTLKTFQQLNAMDKDHARRIQGYMNTNRI